MRTLTNTQTHIDKKQTHTLTNRDTQALTQTYRYTDRYKDTHTHNTCLHIHVHRKVTNTDITITHAFTNI